MAGRSVRHSPHSSLVSARDLSPLLMPESVTIMDRVTDADLRRRMESGSDERVSVLVEADFPPAPTQIQRNRHGTGAVRFALLPESKQERERVDKAAAALSSRIREVVGSDPTWLRSARAFVVDVTGSELAEIAALPGVHAVHRNRRLG